ncbi:uncharacterized protein LOC126995846 [Eriocheir sinensis]|uniref:uncharacterized protein LOC126995846 n=1 Tax=Eriocheir sinensis TaxID=95602 RepID=UPI0021C745FB|nr:uncharacterized protein LOC126995846 [Eriocheir sinensis]XP_050711678.1 uncharacterized protein LOC126995846 [Eriocheir sinensis]XP_050711679.1 uncharacterized protein LOC126995846 [Eriocheir sinensis]
MARRMHVFLILLTCCVTFARSSPLRASSTRLEPRFLNLRGGDSLVRTLTMQRIMILRVMSIAKENGYIVGSISKESVLRAALRLAEYPGVSKVLSLIKQPPSGPEVWKVLQWMKRDYLKYRKMTRQLSDSETLLVRAVETSQFFSTTLTPPTTPSPSPDPRWLLFVPSAPPEFNEEGLNGIASIAEDVAKAVEDEGFFSKLQNNMFINAIITTYSFAVVEFLTSIGLGDVASVGTLVADKWLFYELATEITHWAEEGCFLLRSWPFYYFYPQHCRLLFEQQKRQEELKNSGQSRGAGNTTAPGTGNTTAPGTGNTTAPGTGNTTAPGTGNTTAPGTGNTTAPGTGNTTAHGTGNGNGAGNGSDSGNGNGAGNGSGAGNGNGAGNGGADG